MQWPPWHPRSLRRVALREKAKLEGAPRRTRAARGLRVCAWNLSHHRGWALLLVVPAIGVAFLPIGLSLNPLEGDEKATAILQTLWQVEAAALALSLAVVIFILQAVYSTQPRPPLRGLAEGIGLPAFFYAGIYGLLLTGMVLMGAGDGAPAGWAATWAVIWAALSAGGLILLFVTMLAQIEPDALYRRWFVTVEHQVQRVIENEIFERVAAAVLRDICKEVALDFQPVFGSQTPQVWPRCLQRLLVPSATSTSGAFGRRGDSEAGKNLFLRPIPRSHPSSCISAPSFARAVL